MSDNSVDREDVEHIASIARISIDDDEVDEFVSQFQQILDRFEKLDEVTGNAELDENLRNVVRPDEVRDSLSVEEALSNTKETDDGYFEGPSLS